MVNEQCTKGPRVILYAEDDENDRAILRHAFSQCGLNHILVQVENGRAVVDYLEGKGTYVNRNIYPEADLLLLDLKMPAMDGFDVLAWLRNFPAMAHFPVVVLSGSILEQDRKKALSLGARAYYPKAVNPKETKEMLLNVCRTWLGEQPEAITTE